MLRLALSRYRGRIVCCKARWDVEQTQSGEGIEGPQNYVPSGWSLGSSGIMKDGENREDNQEEM